MFKKRTGVMVNISSKANPINNLTFTRVQGIVTMTIAKQSASHYGADIERLVPEKKGNPVKDTNRFTYMPYR